ncbi:MAG: hypothetical protein IPM71_02610 [Bacteroidota bacterium]|nr:MAG: hypothetical protein IPM71_02610 [Bacteroidota bacterium]
MKNLKLSKFFVLGILMLGAMLLSNGCTKEIEDVQPAVTVGNDSVRLKTDPIGNFDRVNYNNNGLIEGWTADPDAPGYSTAVHIYMNGPAGAGGICIGGAWTSVRRDDVYNAYPWAGYYCGFTYTIPVEHRIGTRVFYVYAINNVAGQNNPCIGNKTVTFGPMPAPPPPTLVSPGNGASVGTPTTFTWNTTPFADRYRIQVSENSNFNTIHFENYTTGLSATFNLKQGTKYYWRVKAFNNTGNTNSSVWSLTTSGSAPYSGDIYATNTAIYYGYTYYGQVQKASVLLKNSGTMATPGFKILYRVDNGSTNIAAGDVDVTLQAGESKWVTRDLDKSGQYPVGYYNVMCWIDINGNVKETNENNNSPWVGAYNVYPN